MAIPIYLAMTAAEFDGNPPVSQNTAWMACHFSPYSTGLSNLPLTLPEGSLLILNDRVPYCSHDLHRISRQLRRAVEALGCAGILLDFQREEVQDVRDLTRHLLASLPCPVVVSDPYAADLDCPVFLSPCPHHVSLEDHIRPWAGRNVWLDLAVDAETITLTERESLIHPLPLGELPRDGHRDENLHCHYSIEASPDSVRFTLWRSAEDLKAVVEEAENLGIQALVGLYQELHPKQFT